MVAPSIAAKSAARVMTAMMINRKMCASLVLAVAWLPSCGKSEPTTKGGAVEAIFGSPQGAGGSAKSVTVHPVVAKWAKAGLTVSAFTPDVSGALGKDCSAGTVNSVDVELCRYPDAAAAVAAEAAAFDWIGAATGTTMVAKEWRLVVVDRRTADPSGRTINVLMKAFP